MIKLKVQITEDKFKYSYEVGGSTFNSESPLTADSLGGFTGLLDYCSNISRSDDRDSDRELTARAWIEKNPKLAKEQLDNLCGEDQ
ncbi:MAG: hypothetical protein IH948_09425 [Bacteroidetes bacterium]|nr:hypothetical protein [Bacteroidota bacterium]